MIVAAAMALGLLVLFHAFHLNGPWYWNWNWRRVEPLRWYPAMLLAAAPAFAAVALQARRPRMVSAAIALLMLSTFGLRMAALLVDRGWFDLTYLTEIVKSPIATSYYGDAGALSNFPGWLGDYPAFLHFTSLHTQSKPPGPLLYWAGIIRIFGYGDRAAVAGGILLAALATLSVPATWAMVGALTASRPAAVLAAAFLALSPGYIYFPTFDPLFIVFACALIVLWRRTIERDSFPAACAFGLTLAAATFCTYLVLTLGAFLGADGLLNTRLGWKRALAVTIRQAVGALAVVAGAYLVLWLITGFDPIATFRQALENQHIFLRRHEPDRIWPRTIPYDLWDFLLGSAWISLILIAMLLGRIWRRGQRRCLGLVILCLAQPVLVGLSGLVQAETARVWAFMLPLWLLPVGLELRAWPPAARLAVFASLWLLTAILGQNMKFVIL